MVSCLLVAGALGWRVRGPSRGGAGGTAEQLLAVADLFGEALALVANGRVVTCNRRWNDLTGLRAGALLALPDEPAWTETNACDCAVRMASRLLASEGGRGVFAIGARRLAPGRDLSEAETAMPAGADPLARLPNRVGFQALIDTRLRTLPPRGLRVLVLDLHRFKYVNDTLGHEGGDELLRRMFTRLSAALTEGDALARLVGDEFAVATEAEAAELEKLTARLIDVASRPFLIDGQVAAVSACIGIADAPSDGTDAETLLRRAALALDSAKLEGAGSVGVFAPELDQRARERRALEMALRRAVAAESFELHYQPQVDSRTGAVTGAEALIRWRDPERGLVPPSAFIPVAEELGLIGEIGRWALEHACRKAMTWPETMSIAVNLSPLQFRNRDLADTVREVLEETGLPASRLELEITETALLADEARTLAILQELHSVGVKISMDDFGTGYSSLSYLHRFPFDKIKIDRSFVAQTPVDPDSSAIVRATIQLATCLGLRTTVEGVETEAQYAFTAGEGCDQIQGYFVSRPLTEEQFARFLSDTAGGRGTYHNHRQKAA